LFLYERTVNKNIHLIKDTGRKDVVILALPRQEILVQNISSEHPQCLLRKIILKSANKRHEVTLVLGLKGLPAQNGQPRYIGGPACLDYLILGNSIEFLAIGKVPGLWIKATLAVIATTGDEEGDPKAFPIDY
jgi:hypothetical protein